MQVTEHVHTIKIPFKLMTSAGTTMDRFVYAYLIYGKRICLIDCGVSSSHTMIFDYLKQTGRNPEEIFMLVLTHSHPDHIGGADGIVKRIGCQVAAHVEAKRWIEDTECQLRERPILNFHSLVENSVKVNLGLREEDSLDLGNGQILKVVHTPGHSKGSISLLFPEDGALFSGDAIPRWGGLPIYEDVLKSIKSIKKLRGIPGLKVLFASWDEPQFGDHIYTLMDQGLKYIQHIHELVCREKANRSSPDLTELGKQVLKTLGLPETALSPIVLNSIKAHLKVSDRKDLLTE